MKSPPEQVVIDCDVVDDDKISDCDVTNGRVIKGDMLKSDVVDEDKISYDLADGGVTNGHVSKCDVVNDDVGGGDNNDIEDENDDKEEGNIDNICSRQVGRVENFVHGFCFKYKTAIKRTILSLVACVYLAFFIYCMQHRFGDEGSIVMLVITSLVFLKIVTNNWKKFGIKIPFHICRHLTQSKRIHTYRKGVKCALYIVATVILTTYLVMEVFITNPDNFRSLFGIFTFILICFVFSTKPSKVNWHPVFWAFTMQFVLALLTLRTEVGYQIFKWLGDNLQAFVSFSDKGSAFIIGENFKDMGLVFSISGIIIFLNGIIFVLCMWGVIEWIVLKAGMFMSWCMECGPVESVVAAANVFIGLTEAPLLVRPYLPSVTRSELHAIMTCGYASISGPFMGMFLRFGVPGNHLLTAAVISAPAALGVSKLLCPETEKVILNNQKNIRMVDQAQQKQSTVFQAFSEGAVMAIPLIGCVMVNMLAFVSALRMVDVLLDWVGQRAGVDGLSFEVICSYILYPLAFMMGTPTEDCSRVSSLIGIKMVATPVVAYEYLGVLVDNRHILEDYTMSGSLNHTWHRVGKDIVLDASNITLIGGVISERAEAISTYALCGLSAFPAIGMSMGALIPICPARKQDVLDLVLRSFVAGNVACFATGAVAGVMFSPNS